MKCIKHIIHTAILVFLLFIRLVFRYKSHILNKKTTKRKRNLRKTTVADVTNVAKVKRMIPYK